MLNILDIETMYTEIEITYYHLKSVYISVIFVVDSNIKELTLIGVGYCMFRNIINYTPIM